MFNMRRLRNIFALPMSKENPEQVPGGIFRKVMLIYFLIQPQRSFVWGGPHGCLSL